MSAWLRKFWAAIGEARAESCGQDAPDICVFEVIANLPVLPADAPGVLLLSPRLGDRLRTELARRTDRALFDTPPVDGMEIGGLRIAVVAGMTGWKLKTLEEFDEGGEPAPKKPPTGSGDELFQGRPDI